MTDFPTLRHGDQSIDGWVEYLQKHLIAHKFPVEKTGVFDDATFDAVVAFQQHTGSIADGVVGDQTWAALRQGDPEIAGTDGQAPHTHVEDTFSARWWAANEGVELKLDVDEIRIYASNVGSAEFDATTLPFAEAVVTPPDGSPVTLPLAARNWDGLTVTVVGGNFYYVGTNVAGLPPGTYKVVATLAAELSGDSNEGHFTITAPT